MPSVSVALASGQPAVCWVATEEYDAHTHGLNDDYVTSTHISSRMHLTDNVKNNTEVQLHGVAVLEGE
jgi:hypothetical protein